MIAFIYARRDETRTLTRIELFPAETIVSRTQSRKSTKASKPLCAEKRYAAATKQTRNAVETDGIEHHPTPVSLTTRDFNGLRF